MTLEYRLSQLQKTRFFYFLVIVAVAGLLLVACSSAPPQIVVEPATQDLGEVPQQPLELIYTVRNEGGSALEIEKTSTSCG